MAELMEGLVRQRADVLVLTEFRNNSAGAALRERLAAVGLVHQAASGAAPRVNHVLVAARRPFSVTPHPLLRFDPARLLVARFRGFSLVAVHLPNLMAKLPHWKALLRMAGETPRARRMMAGDFNTGRVPQDGEGFVFSCAGEMEALEGMGWADAWRELHPRKLEYTWYSHKGRGFRLDHVFLSPALRARLRRAAFVHPFRERGQTDHSALRVELEL